ncbi:VWA domain-containing protein [Winogradskyella aurantiaca]|uniref:VWA domain-containing protein n=1 Tax=Winogradskyella aurantiaca TaxID=2219558 RepID=UPI000E1CAA7E|nr:VWA domain-containing protein [Winogradskyella aurantiaca]
MEELKAILDSGDFQFEYPWIWWLAILPVFVMFLPSRKTKPEALVTPSFKVISELHSSKLSTGVKVAKRHIIAWLLAILVWMCLICAAASPQIVGEPEKQIKTARNFLLNIDLSLSMETKDWVNNQNQKVSRWEAVKEVMEEFISEREGDRMGLILFGSQAYLQTPFTDDLTVVQALLNESEVGMAGAKTAIGNAVGKAVELFERDSIQKKVMVLLTDGEDSGSELKPIQAARLAAVDSITIYTIGIGTKGNNQTYELDDYTLKEMARVANGQYFEASDRAQLEQVYSTLEALEPIEYENNDFIPKKQLFHYPLIFALLITLIYHFLRGGMSFFKNFIAKIQTGGTT